jgi:ribosomal-protein-alanine N-acetyltransferase
VGYTFASLAGSSAELHRLAVRPASRRRGLGSALLDGVVQRVRRYDCDRLLLEVADTNTAAVQMYQRRGFAELSRRRHYYRSGADALVLALDLHQRRHVKQRGGSAR